MRKANSKRFGQAFSFKKKTHHGQHERRKKKATTVKKGHFMDQEIERLKDKIDEGIDAAQINTFSDIPLSANTLAGLKNGKYTTPTDIQRQAICAALQGNDVLGAAKTGSGKTLAFLVPVLEVLHKHKTSPTFGMAALIITPTRELAFQIYEVLNKIRGHHDFSANLIIGGKHMSREQDLMCNTNIVICTPGRLLHHLDQTRYFNADDLKILVLDEADRIMDSKFAKDMDNIIGHLPAERQTLLFSATQTKSVKALARLSLRDPTYVSVDEHAAHVTPTGLEQSYIVCELHEKLSLLFSFLKNHPNTKILVFLQTCKQVRYVHAVIKRERPGMSVMALYGGINQLRRIDIYREFCRKQHAILFATDVACRGLDFPAVNWVVQLDCPVDVDTYIHRAGRTARFQRNGQALLVLLPSEEEHMVGALQQRKIPINKIRVNTKHIRDITGSVAAACASCTETKDMAERAFRTYVYSIHVMKNKKVFDVNKLDLPEFAKSLGLFKTPRLRYLEKQSQQTSEKTKGKGKGASDESSDSEESDDSDESDSDESDSDKSDHEKNSDHSDSGDSGNGLFTVKSSGTLERLQMKEVSEEDENQEPENAGGKRLTKAKAAKKLLRKGITANTRVVFDDEGQPIIDAHKRRLSDGEDDNDEGGINVATAAKRLRVEDEVDKKLERERVKLKHREERIKKKEKRRQESQQRRAVQEDEEEAILDCPSDDDDDDPFKYIPDPDKLAQRSGDGSDDSADESGDDRDDIASASSDDDSDDDAESAGDSGDETDSKENDGSDEEVHGRQQRSTLEDAALQLLNSRKKK